ncbi:MAG: hypothetical protein ACOX6G_08150 [Christensenellales bacterium]
MKHSFTRFLMLLLVLSLLPISVLGEITLSGPNEYPIADEPITLKAFCIPKSQIEDMETNRLTLWLEEKTGIHFEWEVPPASESTTSLNLKLTDTDQPDFYYGMTLGAARIWEVAQDGMIMPLNDLIENYMPNLKKILDENPSIKTAITAPDGNIYSLPRTDGGIHTLVPQKVFIYTPWLEKLNMEMPSTPVEFEAYLQAVKDNDLNENGDTTDEIPLIINSGNIRHVLGFLLAPFEPQPNKRLNVTDGVLTPSFTSDRYREGLIWIKGLVDKGLFSKDSFTIDGSTIKSLTSRPDAMIVGSSGGWFESSFGDMAALPTLWEDYEAVPPLANEEGIRRTINHNGDIALNSFITSTCAYPEALAKWCDFWYSPEGIMTNYIGIEGIHWNWVDEPSIGGSDTSARSITYSDGMTNETWYGTGFRHQDADTRYCVTYTPENLEYHYYTESLKYLDYLPTEYVPSIVWFTDEQSEIVNTIESALLNYVNEMRAAFITGTIDINDDAQWTAYLDELEVIGLQDWVDTYQAAYTAMMSK